MATNTPNINLVKPAYTDNADVGVLNANADKIDAAVKALQDLITALQTSTTPQQLLNAIKTVDGIGSGLDADLLDGKQGDKYFSNIGIIADIRDLNNKFGFGYCTPDVINMPESGHWFVDIKFINTNSRLIEATAIFLGTKYFCIYASGTWSEWEKIGGGNLFTVPRQFSVANATVGQTVFSYSGGAGEVITTYFSNGGVPELVIDGVSVGYSQFPYSGNDLGYSEIRLSFKNSIVIKTSIATSNARGLVMTEK